MSGTVTACRGRTLPKTVRLRKRREFLSIQSGGRRLGSRNFLLVHRPNAGLTPRLGITVTKKIGPAVTRNYLKRAVRETFRNLRAELPPLDLVVIARRGAGELGGTEIATELARVFAQAARENRS